MKSNKFSFLLLLCCLFTFHPLSYIFGQWSYLGTWTEVQMTSNGEGFMISNDSTGSPTGGRIWRLEHTMDDWQNRTVRRTSSPGGLGCCSVQNFALLDADNMLALYFDMGTQFPVRSVDGGFTFSSFGSGFNQQIIRVFPFSASEFVVSGATYVGSKLYITLIQNGQNSGLPIPDTLIGTNARIFKTEANVLFASAVDTNGILRLIRTSDDGSTWTNPLSVGVGNYLEIDFPNDSIGYVGGSDGTFYKTEDGGLNWSSMPLSGAENVGGIQFLNADTGFVATKEGYLLTTLNGGQSWTSELVDSTAIFERVNAISLDAIYLRTVNDKLYKKGDLIMSNAAVSEGAAQLKLVPDGQSNGYHLQLPEAWALKNWQIFNLQGGLIGEGKSLDLSLEGHAAGIYIVRVATNKGLQSVNLVKQ